MSATAEVPAAASLTPGATTIRLSIPVKPLYTVLEAIAGSCSEILLTAVAGDEFSLQLTGLTEFGTVRIAMEAGPPLEGKMKKGEESVTITRDGAKRLMLVLKDHRKSTLTLTVKTNGKLSLGVDEHDFRFLPKKPLLRPAMHSQVKATFPGKPLLRALEDALGCVSRGIGTWTDGVAVELCGEQANVCGADTYHMVKSTITTSKHEPQSGVSVHPEVCHLAVRLLRIGRPQSQRPALMAAQQTQGVQAEEEQEHSALPESTRVSLNLNAEEQLAQWSGHAPGMRWSVRGSLISQRPGQQVQQVCKLAQKGRPVTIEPQALSAGLKMSAVINDQEVQLIAQKGILNIHAATDGSVASVHGGNCQDELQVTVKPAMLRQGLEIFSRADRACGPARMQVGETLISLTSEDQQATAHSEQRHVQYVSTVII